MKTHTMLACVLFLAAGSILMGTQKPAFEAATLKPTSIKDGGISAGYFPGGLFRATNVSLRMLLKRAYRTEDFQIFGAPEWIDSARFDIVAEAGKPAATAEMEVMIQSLIEQRFQLKFHREEKDLPVYALTVAKGGPKLETVKDDNHVLDGNRHGPAAIRQGQLTMQIAPLSQLAAMLSPQLGRPVLDKTGIDGIFNIKLTWTPESAAASPTGDLVVGPSLFTAIQEQLGLRLESQKGPIQAFVIDSAQKPQ